MDPHVVQGMDRYVEILLSASAIPAAMRYVLRTLMRSAARPHSDHDAGPRAVCLPPRVVEGIFARDERRPEPWVGMALIVATKGNTAQAVPIIEKVFGVRPKKKWLGMPFG